MRRREFIAGLLGAAAWPLPLHAQPGRTPRVGLLMLGNPDPSVFLQEVTAGLRELGYEDGRKIVLELRNANGSASTLGSLARELVKLPVDVIVAFQTPVVAAAKAATTQTPIIMCPAQEPVELGFVQSFARPGGNITGMTTATAELAAKNLELIREVLPAVRRLGIIGNAADPFHKPFLAHIETAAGILNFQLNIALSEGADLFPAVFADLAGSGVQAMMVQPSLPRDRAAELALRSACRCSRQTPNLPKPER
jgi:putative ABC transport system substrate-binding protein